MQPEYVGSILTSLQPLSNTERLNLYERKRNQPRYFRIWHGPLRINKGSLARLVPQLRRVS